MPEDWQHNNNGHHHHLLQFWPHLKFKMFGRRHFGWGHFLCRVPFILFWLLVVILILYKTTKSDESNDVQYNIEPELLQWSTVSNNQQDSDLTSVVTQIEGTTNQLLIPTAIEQFESDDSDPNLSHVKSNTRVSIESKASSDISEDFDPRTTTRRSPAQDYMRRSEIFILIIEDQDRPGKAHRLSSFNLGGNLYPNSEAKLNAKSKESHKLIISAHIRQLIEVLTYHRIDYTLGIMHTGLPPELLQNPKRYSVIVIDDFIKYDGLNRWARDQLDRYCRSNRIGVITFLIDNGKLNYYRFASDSIGGHDTSPKIPIISRAMPKFSETSDETTATTEQYPLSFNVLNSNCQNMTSTNCLVDYQLSDKAPLLRILKRKPDFIVKGELGKTLGCSSVVTMSSNHATHEPLTWARLRRLKSATRERSKRHARFRSSPTFPLEADATNQPNSSYAHAKRIRKRAVLPHSISASEKQDIPYDAQNFQDSEYLDDKSEPIDGSDAHKTGGDTQSGHSIGPDLDDDLVSRRVISMLDHGLYDDVRRVIFGISNHHWLNRLLLLDAIEYLSSGQILTPLERYVQIDIDDIFVGASGTRMNSSDVLALIETQKQFGLHVKGGFKFNLGFSGKYFKRGSEAEQAGDELLVANSREFTWFCHFWSHSKAHLFNTTETLSMELIRNLKFAEDNNLTLIGHREPLKVHHLDNGRQLPPTYAVAPHHSGVYPIHKELYEAWHSILNVRVTTTEEYPHLRPASQRRGFAHKTIKVLPRQTCGLYTHTIYRNKYPGSFNKLLASIRGGELFETIVHNPINIYMTHMSNYANDRLALFTFKALFEFVEKNTNLQLIYSPSPSPTTATTTTSATISDEYDAGFDAARTGSGGPLFLANYYFNLHPNEKEPLWTNPCDDKRHLAIWSASKLKFCDIAPKLLIVGPQKTGSTALLSFLRLNPTIETSSTSSEDFEEVQFFNDKHYLEGSDWYFERFIDSEWSSHSNLTHRLYVDKSATYFDDPKAPGRAGSLLPNAYIVILLVNPADRAYSWYQHIKAHGDPIANEFTFEQVIMSQDTTSETQVTNSPALDLRITRDGGGSSPTSSSTSSASGSTSRRLTDRQVAAVRGLRNRCLHPGYYSNHLLKWLDYFPSRQIFIIDGEWFKLNPVAVLNRLQLVLRLPHQLDYDQLLVYSKRKGFYCERVHRNGGRIEGSDATSDQQQLQTTSIKCLGPGKGRKYVPMSAEARNYLDDHYLIHNRQLAKLLYEIGQPLPNWLDRSINPLPPTTARLL